MIGILCFGDSITYGEGDEEGKGWCGRLKEWFEAKNEDNGVYNLGVGGQTAGELLERFEAECKARMRFKHPTDAYTILIAIGANDAKYEGKIDDGCLRTGHEEFGENISKLIKKAKKLNSRLEVIGLMPVDEEKINSRDFGVYFTQKNVTRLNKIIMEACEKETTPFLDLNKKMLATNYEEMLFDGLHPNSKGYDFMFTEIKKFLGEKKLLPGQNNN